MSETPPPTQRPSSPLTGFFNPDTDTLSVISRDISPSPSPPDSRQDVLDTRSSVTLFEPSETISLLDDDTARTDTSPALVLRLAHFSSTPDADDQPGTSPRFDFPSISLTESHPEELFTAPSVYADEAATDSYADLLDATVLESSDPDQEILAAGTPTDFAGLTALFRQDSVSTFTTTTETALDDQSEFSTRRTISYLLLIFGNNLLQVFLILTHLCLLVNQTQLFNKPLQTQQTKL